MAQVSCPRASASYFAYEDTSVQDIKALARAAGFTGNTSQGALLTYMAFESRVQGFVSKVVGPAMLRERDIKRPMLSARCIFPLGALREQPRRLLHPSSTVISRSTCTTSRQNLVRFRCASFRTSGARRHPQ